MVFFDVTLVLSTLLCSLVAGFLFSYAIVVMPGIKQLDDKQFIKTFQVTDRVIQDNHPLFLLVWVGSAIALIACAAVGFANLQGVDFILLLLAIVIYLVGVQVATIVIHLPLNNKLQTLDIELMTHAELKAARLGFESRWNRSNEIRTAIACTVSMILIVLVWRQ